MFAKTFTAALLLATAISPALAAETVVTLESGVIGTLSLPETGASGPAVVMLHGFASNRDEIGGIFAAQAAALAEAGIASLRIDFRGYGVSDPASEASVTIDRMLEDAAIAMLAPDDFAAVAVWGQMGISRANSPSSSASRPSPPPATPAISPSILAGASSRSMPPSSPA